MTDAQLTRDLLVIAKCLLQEDGYKVSGSVSRRVMRSPWKMRHVKDTN